jgi:hypothetical protein
MNVRLNETAVGFEIRSIRNGWIPVLRYCAMIQVRGRVLCRMLSTSKDGSHYERTYRRQDACRLHVTSGS